LTKLYSEDFDLFFEDEVLSLGVRLDSKSTIYRFKYHTEDADYLAILDGLNLADKKLEVLSSLNFLSSLKDVNTLKINQLYNLFYSMYCDFTAALSSVQFIAEKERLVCRCMGVTDLALDKSFKENKADVVKTIQATNASMSCGSCRDEVKLYLSNHWLAKVADDSVETLSKINKALDDFSMFCPMELGDYSFEAVSIKNAQVKVKAVKGKLPVKRPEITKTLKNYLGDKILSGLDLSVFY
jgi:NAD(P)H-nitrite reductase large subunit